MADLAFLPPQMRKVASLLIACAGLVAAGWLGRDVLISPAARATGNPPASAGQVDLVSAQLNELRGDVRGLYLRLDAIERWQAKREGIEEQRARDATTRSR